MGSFARHLRAVELAAALSIGTVALAALPLLAAHEATDTQYSSNYYTEYIVRTFQKIGASAGVYDNRSVETSAFDFARFVSHTCFRPTEFDMTACKAEFGPYHDLRAIYESGKLAEILRTSPYLVEAARMLPSRTNQSTHSPSFVPAIQPPAVVAPASEVRRADQTRRSRSEQLWDICDRRGATRQEEVDCYQRNIRLIERTEVIENSIVY